MIFYVKYKRRNLNNTAIHHFAIRCNEAFKKSVLREEKSDRT